MLFLFAHYISISSFAQVKYDAKRDYVWVFGYEGGSIDSVNHTYLDFKSDTLTLNYVRTKSHDIHQTNASVCDTEGNLLFFSNGCVLIDSAYELINGADTINRGVRWKNYCDKGSEMTYGYVVTNGCWILPITKDKYKAVYIDLINSTAHTSGVRFSDIVQSESDRLIGSNPDTYLFQADLHSNKSAFVRHANGRDWWQVSEAYSEHRYYISLIDSSNQTLPTKQQTFNIPTPEAFHGGGQSCFSPDGLKFMAIDAYNQCQVFDFDRCKGELSNLKHIPLPVPYDSIVSSTGIAVSPSSRFMYLMTLNTIWQYDLTATDIETSKIKVAQRDNWVDPFYQVGTHFYQSQIGPDGKIYVFPPGARRDFTVIDNPDVKGVSCNVLQHKYYKDNYHFYAQPPRFPNFRLGPEVGSSCDTLTVSTNSVPALTKASMTLRPNPATSFTVADVSVPDYSAEMQITLSVSDLSGSVLGSYAVPPYAALQRIETEHLPNGVYFVTLKSKGRVLKTEKLVVLRE
jgi:hypothetical protein